MQSVVNELIGWQLHPVVDHFSVALIIIAIITDLVATILPSRLWLRYMAVTLMVLGAIFAAGSFVTGSWEANRVWDLVTGPAKDVLKRHAQLGEILPWVFGALALWRLAIQFLGFISGSRPLYLLVALVAAAAIIYQGHEGGELVYTYGVGTAVMPTEGATPSPSMLAPATPPVVPSSAPTLYVPSTAATPPAPASPAPSAEISPSGTPAPSASSTPAAEPSPMVTPSPASSGGTPVNPPAGAAVPSASESPGAPKTL